MHSVVRSLCDKAELWRLLFHVKQFLPESRWISLDSEGAKFVSRETNVPRRMGSPGGFPKGMTLRIL